jgi:hypothetical protein
MTTTTAFYSAASITQVASINDITLQPTIPWEHSENVINESQYAVTKSGLYTISGLWMEKFRSSTNELWTTSYNIPNFGSVVGIELQVGVQRAARISDLVIQLTLNGELIGYNYASGINPVQSDMYTAEFTTPMAPIGDYHIYGGNSDMWGTTLTSTDIANATFGAVVSFQSNQIVPHRDLAYLDQVAIRITYA